MDEQNKNLILATVLSALVILVWLVLFPPQQPVPALPTGSTEVATQPSGSVAVAPTVSGDGAAIPVLADEVTETRELALAESDRVVIDTARLSGSISLQGGRIDDLSLNDYRVTLAAESATETLLSPAGGPDAYYTVYGWAPAGGLDANLVPNANTDWTLESGTVLSVNAPITLVWDNQNGMIFRRDISIDENYMFTVKQSVANTTGVDQRMFPYGIVARKGEPDTIGFYILHEGVVRSSDGELQEIDYNDMPDQDPAEGGAVDKIEVTDKGWIGFTDKYWMTTLIPNAGQRFDSISKYTPSNDTYQTEIRLPVMTIAAGETQSITTSLFAGAKEWETLRNYQDDLGVDKFIDAIDWGIFSFLTKPIFQVLHFMNGLIGNMGIAIISLTLLIKALLLPLAYKSYVSMAKMKELQPEMQAMKERAGDDKQKLQKDMMALYKEKKVNPASGCLPILLQIPIFFSLYKVIFVTIELRHAPFFGWIQDLSAPDPTSFMNLFGLMPWDAPGTDSFIGILSIGVFPILMGVTMWMQQKLNPAPTDKTQAQIFAWMPWVFMFMLGRFASGLVVYWVANNTITFTQQYLIMRSQGVKPDVFGNILSGFRKSKDAEN